jgi:hypothetical protein
MMYHQMIADGLRFSAVVVQVAVKRVLCCARASPCLCVGARAAGEKTLVNVRYPLDEKQTAGSMYHTQAMECEAKRVEPINHGIGLLFPCNRKASSNCHISSSRV